MASVIYPRLKAYLMANPVLKPQSVYNILFTTCLSMLLSLIKAKEALAGPKDKNELP